MLFGIEIEDCARCGGKLKVIASIEEPQVIGKILAHLEKTAPDQFQAEPALGVVTTPLRRDVEQLVQDELHLAKWRRKAGHERSLRPGGNGFSLPPHCGKLESFAGERMNGIHDLGGMTCFGPVRRETDEPVFHADWERRMFGTNLAVLAFFGPLDRARHAVERIDPIEYLTTSYYEHWLAGTETLARELGYVTASELESGTSAMHKDTPHPPPDAGMIEGLVRGGVPASRQDGRRSPRFAPGDAVRARNILVSGHTRLPRYVRGRMGRIEACRGSHVFPDTAAHDRGENAQPLYSVRFEARELWGDNVERRDCVYIDLWEDYLEPVETRT